MQKSSRYWVRLALAFLDRFKLIFLIGIIMGFAVFLFFGLFFPSLTKETQKIGVVGEYTTDNLPNQIASMISMGLTTIDKTGKATQGIAESWEISDSGKTWTFHLRKNLHWQDGSVISTADVNYNFSDATITKPDKYTIVFKLSTTFAPFPVAVSKPIFKQGLLGVGEWKVTGLTLAGSFIETLSLQNNTNIRKIYKFYPNIDRAKLSFQLGEIDVLNDIPEASPFDTWKVIQVDKNVNKQRYVAVFFNTSTGATGDKDFRQALSYSIDKSQFPNERALGPVSSNSWAFNPTVKPYDFNIEHAKELIDVAKIDPATKKNLKIKLTTIPDLLTQAEMIAKNWKQIGVETTIQVNSYIPEDYQALLAVYDIPSDPDQYFVWHSKQKETSVSRYANTRIDKLLEDGRLETKEDKRKQIYFDFQRFLVEDAPAAFLYYPNYYTVIRK